MSKLTKKARELGRERGLAAASWVFDGDTSQETYAAFVRAYDDGDPMGLEAFGAPSSGWLSGEYAGDLTPAGLAAELGLVVDGAETLDELCHAYEEAAEGAYWAELERVARLHTDEKGA